METFIRRHFWQLAGVILLFAVLAGAATALLDVEVEQAQLQSSLRVRLPDSQLAHEARWSLMPRESDTSAPGIREVAEHTYELSGADLDAAFARPGELTRQARVVPAFRDGLPQGFTLFAIQPGSFFEKLGLQSGDVVRRINGQTLDAPDKALEAFTRMREARLIRIELERRGVPIQKLYAVK
jgi:hypothetical protein